MSPMLMCSSLFTTVQWAGSGEGTPRGNVAQGQRPRAPNQHAASLPEAGKRQQQDPVQELAWLLPSSPLCMLHHHPWSSPSCSKTKSLWNKARARETTLQLWRHTQQRHSSLIALQSLAACSKSACCFPSRSWEAATARSSSLMEPGWTGAAGTRGASALQSIMHAASPSLIVTLVQKRNRYEIKHARAKQLFSCGGTHSSATHHWLLSRA